MQRTHERKVDADPTSELMAMAIMLFTLPNRTNEADAIVVLPGQGEDWRLFDAVAAWNNSPKARFFIVAGNYPGETTWFLPTEEILRERFGLTRTDGTIIIHPEAENTKTQADWLIPTVSELGITSFALVVSPYHLLRAYCCMLKAFDRLGVKRIPMLPVPVEVSPAKIVPETGLTGWDLVHGEVRRILTYREWGDIAMPHELYDYLKWLWEQPAFAHTATPCARA